MFQLCLSQRFRPVIKLLFIALFLSPYSLAQALPVSAISDGDGSKRPTKASPAQELKALQESLAVKKKELARLHHKWTVAKGRVPSKEELKEFEEKRAKGKATMEDNPYINKKPLSSPGLSRQAYYQKLEEVRQDEAWLRQLGQDLTSRGLREQ